MQNQDTKQTEHHPTYIHAVNITPDGLAVSEKAFTMPTHLKPREYCEAANWIFAKRGKGYDGFIYSRDPNPTQETALQLMADGFGGLPALSSVPAEHLLNRDYNPTVVYKGNTDKREFFITVQQMAGIEKNPRLTQEKTNCFPLFFRNSFSIDSLKRYMGGHTRWLSPPIFRSGALEFFSDDKVLDYPIFDDYNSPNSIYSAFYRYKEEYIPHDPDTVIVPFAIIAHPTGEVHFEVVPFGRDLEARAARGGFGTFEEIAGFTYARLPASKVDAQEIKAARANAAAELQTLAHWVNGNVWEVGARAHSKDGTTTIRRTRVCYGLEAMQKQVREFVRAWEKLDKQEIHALDYHSYEGFDGFKGFKGFKESAYYSPSLCCPAGRKEEWGEPQDFDDPSRDYYMGN